jgi:glycosyltransferase involved in cell wall biosynthesis
VPVVSTFHGRLDLPWAADLFADKPAGLVAISRSHAAMHPDVPFTVIHNGLTLDAMPFERRRSDDLVFVGRVAPEKGIMDAIEIARLSGRRLRIAAKIGTQPDEMEYYETVFKPALDTADVEFVGEIGGAERDQLVASAYAMVLPASWPEPFGLVVIESLACGTPVIARRVGALPEIVREDIDGFFGDDVSHMAFLLPRVEKLDRRAIRASVLDRFSATRMVDGYERLFEERLAAAERPATLPAAVAAPRGNGTIGRTIERVDIADGQSRTLRPVPTRD